MTKSVKNPKENFSKEGDGNVVVKENSTTDEKIDGLMTGFVGLQNSFDQFFEFLKQNSPQKKRVSKGMSEEPYPSDDPDSSDDEDDDNDGDDSGDGDNSDIEESIIKRNHKSKSKGKIRNLKIDFKLDIKDFDGSIDVEKLDDWIDRLETYFTLYRFSSEEKLAYATIKLSKHALTWWKSYKRQANRAKSWKEFKRVLRVTFYPVGYLEERWFKWYSLKQQYNQSVQEYTSDFRNQALVLDLRLDDFAIYMKYVSGLAEYIRKELKMFSVTTLAEACVKATAIEGKLKKTKNGNQGKSSSSSQNSSQEKSTKEGVVCTHCKQSGHPVEKCWEKNPHMKPKRIRSREAKALAAQAQNSEAPKILPGLTEPIKKSMMASVQGDVDLEDLRERLFIVRIQVKTSIVDCVIDSGSQKNLISGALVEKLGLETKTHPRPYPLSWLQSKDSLIVDRQCTFKFALDESYIDEVTCDVVPLDVCQVMLGSPYLFDRDGVLERRKQQYTFTKDGTKFVIRAIDTPHEGISLVTATQAKRMVNASRRFVLLMVRALEEKPSRLCLMALSQVQENDLVRLKDKFKDLFSDIDGLPPHRSVEHEIMLTATESLPNVGLYRTTVEE